MTTIDKTFTYTLPNEPKIADFSNNVTVNARYVGPRYFLVIIDDATNKIAPFGSISADLEETFTAPPGHTVVKVDCDKDPLLGALMDANTVTLLDPVEDIAESLPGNNVYSYTWPMFIGMAYIVNETTYDSSTNTWTYVHAVAEDDWEGIINERNARLSASDACIAPDMPDALKQKWIDYRQALRDLPETWAGVKSWKVVFPKSPNEV